MKKIYLLFAFALLALVAGAQTTYEYDFYSGGFTQGNQSKVFNGIEWTLTSDCERPSQHSWKGQEFKATTTAVIKTSAFKGAITSIKIVTGLDRYDYNDEKKSSVSISVGGKAYKADDQVGNKQQENVFLIGSGREYNFTGGSEGEIVITFSNQSQKTIILGSIAVTYGGSVTPDIPEVLEPVTFSLASGVYTSTQTVEVSCPTPDAHIVYEFWKNDKCLKSGGAPSPVSFVLDYEEGKQNTYVIRALSSKNQENTKQISSSYVIGDRCPTPDFSIISGTYYGSRTLEVSTFLTGPSVGFTYSFYKDGTLVKSSVEQSNKMTFELTAEPGKDTRYVVNMTTVNGDNLLQSDLVTHEYLIREAGIDRVFEKITTGFELSAYSNFTLLSSIGDCVIGGYSDQNKKYNSVEVNPAAVDTYTYGAGATILKVEPAKTSVPNVYYFKNEITSKYLKLVLNASGKYEFYEVDKPDQECEWTISDAMELQNVAMGKDFLSFNEETKSFNYCENTNGLQIFKENGSGSRVTPDPDFSLPEGLYISDKTVVISSKVPGSRLRYSVKKDGWQMIEETIADAPVEVALTYAPEGTTYVIEAAVSIDGYAPGRKVSKTYTFKDICGNEFISAQVVVSEVAAANNWVNGNQYNTFSFTDIHGTQIDFTNRGGSNDGKYYTSNHSWRNYQDGELIISIPQGLYLNRVEFEANNNINNCTWEKGVYGQAPYTNAWVATDYTNTMTMRNAATSNTCEFRGFTIYYTNTISGVEDAVANEVEVFGVDGGVKVVANAEAEVAVYSLAGQLVGLYQVATGETMIDLEQGFYVVRTEEKVAKVIVK